MASNTVTDVEKAAKEIQDAQKAQQTILATLAKFQQISGFIDQAHDLIHKPEEKKADAVPKKLIHAQLSTTVKRERPVLFPMGKDFDAMFSKFKAVCKNVHKRNGDWSSVRSMASFNSICYSTSSLSAADLFSMLWFVAAILTQNFSNKMWCVDADMEPLIEAINMINALEFVPKTP